jgi:large subunit ribosomal protein LX
MSEVKIFRVIGEIRKPNLQTNFRREIRALKPEEAVERIYMELGSKHKAKRFQIKIIKVEEVKPEEIESPLVRKLTLGEKESVK